MTTHEKIVYLQGLIEMFSVGADQKLGAVLKTMSDVLSDIVEDQAETSEVIRTVAEGYISMAESVEDIDRYVDGLAETVDNLELDAAQAADDIYSIQDALGMEHIDTSAACPYRSIKVEDCGDGCDLTSGEGCVNKQPETVVDIQADAKDTEE